MRRPYFIMLLMRLNTAGPWEIFITTALGDSLYVLKWNRSVVSDSLWPKDCSPPSSSVHGILQARILEWIAIFFRPSDLQAQFMPLCMFFLSIRFFCAHQHCPSPASHHFYLTIVKVKWSRSVVSDSLRPVDCSPPSSSVHGILQARILEWVAISFSRGSSRPRDRTQVSRIAGRRFNLWATRGTQLLSC